MEVKNVGQLRKIIENLSDDYEIEMRVRRKLSDEELKECRYPYPYDTEYLTLEFDDIGVSDKVLCLGVTSKINQHRTKERRLNMYVARDKDGDLYLYKKQPVKYSESWQLCSDNPHDFYKLDSSLFPEVKWEDEEPTEVELVKKGK